jgi:choice-of-anchor B domain-containing protein
MRLSIAVFLTTVMATSNVLAQYQPGVNNNITLLGHLHQYNGYANVWGYTDSEGNEYALLGTDIGLSVINVTDPANPVEVDFVPGPLAPPYHWREIKTFSHYAYVVSEGTTPNQFAGLQVVDLSTLPDSVRSFHSVLWPGVNSTNARAHTVTVDDAGYLYIQGGTTTKGTGGVDAGVRIFSLANAWVPVSVSFYSPRYVHDSFVKNNILFNSNIFDGGHVDILDVTDRSRPRLLTSIIYPQGFTHNSWTTEDGKYLFTTDENEGLTVKVWDIRVLWDGNPANDNSIELVAEYIGDKTQIAHNVHIKGDHAFISHYVEGVKVLDIADPTDPVEVGYYDTFPQPGNGYMGAWGVFPYFPSGNFVVSDMQTGLYVLQFDGAKAGGVQGKVTDIETGGELAGVALYFVEANKKAQTDFNGDYKLRTNSGRHTIVLSRIGYFSNTLTVDIPPGAENLRLDIQLQPENAFIAFDVDSIRIVVPPDEIKQTTFSILNTGTGTLRFSIRDSVDFGGSSNAKFGSASQAERKETMAVSQNDAPWLSTSPESGAITGLGSQEITLTFDAGGLPEGSYPAWLIVHSNDPIKLESVIPVIMEVRPAVSVHDQPQVPFEFVLAQNQPNPFRLSTQFDYSLSAPSRVELKIYNLSGQLVKTLISGQQAGGFHSVRWNATDERGEPVAGGVYLYMLATPVQQITRKLLLMK